MTYEELVQLVLEKLAEADDRAEFEKSVKSDIEQL